ncbi:oxidoreductase [Streptomyces tateyamensis]|uniref:Oxidoreductase n=1 Tax=Streptomyces tateyamensis TaxID=565073 RepID=A0A2V4NZQ9_9ACTN|nr:oxidoreductase [Streptomyces tateyamensis]PYC87737.1 oxidoreductase [Streptomyces tateyamensis]
MEQAPAGWSEVEQRLWRAFGRGDILDLASGDQAADDPATGAAWGAERTVRAETLARVLLAGPAPEPGRVRGLKLVGARIAGRLWLAGGRFESFVELHDCYFDTGAVLSEAHAGTVRLDGCHIPRLDASRLDTSGDLVLARCTVLYGVRLTDAQIGTDLIANHLRVGTDQFGRSFSADGMTVHQDFEADRLECDGELSLRTARIGGRFSLRGAQLRGRPGKMNCFNAARLSVGSTFYLTGWRDPKTMAQPQSPDRGGLLEPAAAGRPNGPELRYSRPEGDPGPYRSALPPQRLGEREGEGQEELEEETEAATRMVYGQGFGEDPESGIPFRAFGGVRLEDARFETACLINYAEFHLGEDQELSLRRIQTPELRFTCPAPPTGKVALSRARVGNLIDRPTAWPRNHEVRLTGFSYEALRSPEGAYQSVHQRIAWLDQALDTFHPEPYEQLAAALRRDGLDDDARQVQYAKQQRRARTLPAPGRAWSRLQDITVGYGYRPGRAALWLLAAWAVGTLWFAGHPPAPVKVDEHPHWNPALYAASLVLPIVNFGMDGWAPAGVGQWLSAVLVLSGWVLASTVVTGATRVLQRG